MSQFTLRPAIVPRERILTFGGPGAGKSSGLLEIARRCPDTTFHICDTDFGSYAKLLATQFTDLTNVEVHTIEEWPETVETVKKIIATMGKDDWLVVDSITPTWDMVQGWFVEAVHGVDIDQFFLERRKALQKIRDDNAGKDVKVPKGFAAISGEDGDWQVINKHYFALYRLLRNAPGHVYLTAEAEMVGKDDDGAVKDLFGGIGVKAKGQKKLGYVPDSVIWLRKKRTGEWTMSSVNKDRGREELDDEPFDNFAVTYLMKVAGWRPVKIGET